MPFYPGIFSMSGKSGAVATYGLIDFGNDNSTQYYSLPDIPTLDLGSGAWAWFIWTRVEENTGTAYQYLLSSGVQPATPSFVWYLGEASADIAGEQNKFVARIVDDAGVNTGALISTVTTGADSVERLCVLQSTGTTVEMWLCPKNGTATRVVNAATNLGAITAPVAWNIGRRTDGEAARYWEEWLGGIGQANVALSQANIESIAGGTAPATVLGANLENYWSFVGKTIGQNQDGASGSPTTATYRTTSGAAPTIHGSESLAAFATAASPQVITLSGQTYSAGDYLLVPFGADGIATITSMAGATNDTFTEVIEIDHASNGSNLAVYEGTVVSGLDASISVTMADARDACGGLITIAGAAANASQPDVTPSTNQGEDVTPICSSITTVTNNCLVFAIFHARGGHSTGFPPDAPTGTGTWTLLYSGTTGATETSTSQSAMAIAYKVQATAGATGAATWTNALDASNRWTAVQFAVRPA